MRTWHRARRRGRGRRRVRIDWGHVVLAGIAAALAVYIAWSSYQRRQDALSAIQRPAQASTEAVSQEPALPASNPHLKPGERCNEGRFQYQVTLLFWADAPPQDWKCQPGANTVAPSRSPHD